MRLRHSAPTHGGGYYLCAGTHRWDASCKRCSNCTGGTRLERAAKRRTVTELSVMSVGRLRSTLDAHDLRAGVHRGQADS